MVTRVKTYVESDFKFREKKRTQTMAPKQLSLLQKAAISETKSQPFHQPESPVKDDKTPVTRKELIEKTIE